MAHKEYQATRLLFRADIIESLADSDIFSIHTPEGTFSMSKADFHKVFSNVIRTKSYREKGIYHYPTTPQKAIIFLKMKR